MSNEMKYRCTICKSDSPGIFNSPNILRDYLKAFRLWKEVHGDKISENIWLSTPYTAMDDISEWLESHYEHNLVIFDEYGDTYKTDDTVVRKLERKKMESSCSVRKRMDEEIVQRLEGGRLGGFYNPITDGHWCQVNPDIVESSCEKNGVEIVSDDFDSFVTTVPIAIEVFEDMDKEKWSEFIMDMAISRNSLDGVTKINGKVYVMVSFQQKGVLKFEYRAWGNFSPDDDLDEGLG